MEQGMELASERKACRLGQNDLAAALSIQARGSMVWFVCDDCGDTIKKPKVPQHLQQCSASRFTCLDCSRSFDRHTVKGHATCVTEVDKYAKGATKPGGYAAQGYYKDGTGATIAVIAQPVAGASDPADTAFLSVRPPWTCSVCKVTCTSQDTLLGHAAGVKHRRRARAAAKDQKGSDAADEIAAATPQPASAIPHANGLSNGKRAAVQAVPVAVDESSHKSKKHKASDAPSTAVAPAAAARREAEDLAVSDSDDTGEDTTALLREQRLNKIKWKKLAAQVLKEHKGTLKLAKLQKQLRLAAQVSDDHAAAADAVIQSRLKGSSQFLMKGKSVLLASAH